MELRILDVPALRRVYDTHLTADFPPEERKPLSAILRLREAGVYDTLGFYREGALVGYAFVWHDGERDYALVDYLAVCRGNRGRGAGTEMLRLLERRYRDYDGLLVEAEAPGTDVPPEENAQRTRRIAFYRRAGFHVLGRRVYLFRVWYELLASGKAEPEAAVGAHRRLYRGHLPPERSLPHKIVYEKS